MSNDLMSGELPHNLTHQDQRRIASVPIVIGKSLPLVIYTVPNLKQRPNVCRVQMLWAGD